jgi:Tol biopolymer transport system component
MRSFGRRLFAATGIVCAVAAAGCGDDDSTGPFAADEPRIAFATDRDADFEIYAMNSDGSNPVRLTNSPGVDNQPAWTPDGNSIVFTSNRSANLDIWIMAKDGANPRNVTAFAGTDDNPAVSPDGTRIAFSSDRDGDREIYVINVDGTGLVQLTTDPAADNAPSWSPDGLRIAFQSTRGDGLADDVFVMNVNGTNVVRLTTDALPDQVPSWSTSGTIAFVTSRTGNPEIFTMLADGSAKTNVSNNAAVDTQPSYSRQQPAFVAFTSFRDHAAGEIYVMGSDGIATRLTSNTFVDENAALK